MDNVVFSYEKNLTIFGTDVPAFRPSPPLPVQKILSPRGAFPMTKVSRICQTMVLGIAAGIFLFLCAWRLINVMGGFEPHCTPDVLPKRRDADEKIALFTILWDVAHCDSTKRALEVVFYYNPAVLNIVIVASG